MLHKFQHEQPDYLQNAPHQHVIPSCGAKVQQTMSLDMSDPLDKIRNKKNPGNNWDALVLHKTGGSNHAGGNWNHCSGAIEEHRGNGEGGGTSP
eukprot:6471242-Ditylum_brightwellii.AAC.1